MSQLDLIVVGSGPAGEKGAVQAAYFGKRVAVIERDPVPGGARITSCALPSKNLSETLKPKSTAYHEIWLDKKMVAGEAVKDFEPIYGPYYLPRKVNSFYCVRGFSQLTHFVTVQSCCRRPPK